MRNELFELAKTSPTILVVKLANSKFFHYLPRESICAPSDKRTAQALCGHVPENESWRLVKASGKACQACHAVASRTLAVVGPPPKFEATTRFRQGHSPSPSDAREAGGLP